MREKFRLLFLLWTIGLAGGLIFTVLKLTGRVRISGFDREKLRPGENGLIVISNHPSFWEPAILPFLFFPRYLFSLRSMPISVVDKANYSDQKWFSPFRFACLPVKRRDPREEVKAAEAMLSILRKGGVIIIYPEAGRTFRGEEFKYSASGNRIRCFPEGLRKLFSESGSPVLPLWVEGGDRIIFNEFAHPMFPHFTLPRIWRVMTVRFGSIVKVNGIPRKEVIGLMEDTLLKLGEE